MMDRALIEKTVDKCFDEALGQISGRVNMELYPDAFANEYSWLRVKAVFNLSNQAMRNAVRASLVELLSDQGD